MSVELMPNPDVVLGNTYDVPVVKPVAKPDGLGTPKIELVLAFAEFELMTNPDVVLGNACDVPVVKPVEGLRTPKIDEFVLAVAAFDELKPNPGVDLKSILGVFGTPNTVPVPEEVGKPKEDWLDGAGSLI
ncbi:hypothetical protein CASFOL_035645 [Castilleja foliolosa]|uniref:Uncharacterized protein n=1 Tax=Castilleja foliolosa TaxID=1961234 RepID=A0ABD3BU33_9LAMI